MTSLLTTILLATDGSPAADEAGRAAIALADLTGAALHVVQAWNVPDEHDSRSISPIDRAYLTALYQRQARESLAGALGRLTTAGGQVTGSQLGHGRPAAAVLAEAATVGANLIVTGSRGVGPAKGILLGSVAEGIVRGADCSVLVVRGDDTTWPPARIVVGVDGAQESRRATEFAALIAAPVRAALVLLRAVPTLPPAEDPSAQDQGKAARFQAAALQRAENDLMREADALTPLLGYRPTVYATVEDADIALLRVAEEGDGPTLIAVGTRGTAPAGRLWLGSTALRVLTYASSSVLICPHRCSAGENNGGSSFLQDTSHRRDS